MAERVGLRRRVAGLALTAVAVVVVAGCDLWPVPEPSHVEPPPQPTTTCSGVTDATCHQIVILVTQAYPSEIATASAVVVADTCPPPVVCDRKYPIDAAVVIVPRDPAVEPLWLQVVGINAPEKVEAWRGPHLRHVEALLPAR